MRLLNLDVQTMSEEMSDIVIKHRAVYMVHKETETLKLD